MCVKSQGYDWESSNSFPKGQRLKRRERFAARSTLTLAKLTLLPHTSLPYSTDSLS